MKVSILWRLALVLLLAAFVATRIGMILDLTPIFDADTYKYFGGADSLWHGTGWPPVYVKMHDGGGALHTVPGYTYFFLGVWHLAGGPTLTGVAIAQSVVSFLGLLATGAMIRRWYGDAAAVLVVLLLVAAPSLAWMDQFLMPESLGASTFVLAMWFVSRIPAGRAWRSGAAGAAIASGLLISAGVLLRTSAQIFVPFPIVMAFARLANLRQVAAWTVLYVFAFVVPLVPWMAHNYRVHGHPVIAASTGRNLYFTGIWTNTIDRGEQMKKLGPGRAIDVNSSYYLLDAQLNQFLASGMDIAGADAAMGRLAIDEYRKAGIRKYLDGRLANLEGLFQPESFGRKNLGLTEYLNWYMADGGGSDNIRKGMEERWGYWLTPESREVMRSTRAAHTASSHYYFARWVQLVKLDNLPLAITFAIATLVLVARARSHFYALVVFALPVWAYLFVFTIFGAPLYRYQSVEHAPMLVVIGIAAWQLLRLVNVDRSAHEV